jgi:hypothetical protein
VPRLLRSRPRVDRLQGDAAGIAYTKRENLPQSVSDAAAQLVATIKEIRK